MLITQSAGKVFIDGNPIDPEEAEGLAEELADAAEKARARQELFCRLSHWRKLRGVSHGSGPCPSGCRDDPDFGPSAPGMTGAPASGADTEDRARDGG